MEPTETAVAEYLFHQGTNFHAYEYLGAHRISGAREDPARYVFRVWAPGARDVALVGDFCGWEGGLPLRRVSEKGVFEVVFTTHGSLAGQKYKFRVTSASGTALKGDPYAFASEGGAGGASIVCDPSGYEWRDAAWMERRTAVFPAPDLPAPLNIYEMQAGSFCRHEDGRPFSYAELGDTLSAYLRFMGYTHVEFLPLAEYPFDGSWGYQVCAYYAPTARFGRPDDFRALVDRLHGAGIGVIMDWVPAHFPKDGWGLYEFDGGPLYEYGVPDRMESRGWGTRYFDVGREEVQSFLVSNALYWLREFHLDGLRVDAVAAMLYRDYDRPDGAWTPNSFGGKENLESIAFFRKLNGAVAREFPDALMIAEESTAFPGVTAPPEEGGLGFRLKWNMGMANDFFRYLEKEPIFRRYHHAALTFPMIYAYSEKYVLPVSHDEVVYGKRSLLSKISGTREEQIETFRAALVFLMTFPGKKMLFMGTEFGQVGEWDPAGTPEWYRLDEPAHLSLRDFTAALNRFYLASPALWERDFVPEGFAWLDPDRADEDLVAYRRIAADGSYLITVVSFSGVDLWDYRLPLPEDGLFDVVFYSGYYADGYEKTFVSERDERGAYLMMRVPARTAVILARRAPGFTLTLSRDGREEADV